MSDRSPPRLGRVPPAAPVDLSAVRLLEADIRARQHAERMRTMGAGLLRTLYDPHPGAETGRTSEIDRMEDASLTEAVFAADLMGQTWVAPSIDMMLSYRVSWERQGRKEAVVALSPPPEGAGQALAPAPRHSLLRRLVGHIPLLGRLAR